MLFASSQKHLLGIFCATLGHIMSGKHANNSTMSSSVNTDISVLIFQSFIPGNNAASNMQRQTCLWISTSKVVRWRTLFLSYSSVICTTSLGTLLKNFLSFAHTKRESARKFTHSSSNSRVSWSHFSRFWVAVAYNLLVHLADVCRTESTRVFLRIWSRSNFIDVIMAPFGSRSNARVCSKRDSVIINDQFAYCVSVPLVHLYNTQKWWSFASKVTERILINRGNIWGVKVIQINYQEFLGGAEKVANTFQSNPEIMRWSFRNMNQSLHIVFQCRV